MNFLIMQFSPASQFLFLFVPKYDPQNFVFKHPRIMLFALSQSSSSHPLKWVA